LLSIMTVSGPNDEPTSGSFARWMPALARLRSYDRTWILGDVVAGITCAAYLPPAALVVDSA
jgi:SulP family sulfate permease